MATILLLVLLVAAATVEPAATATFRAEHGTLCKPATLARDLVLHCSPSPAKSTSECCGVVLAAVDLGGGVPCLCRATAEPRMVLAGLNASTLLLTYSASCAGVLSGGVEIADACKGTLVWNTARSFEFLSCCSD
jgi:hypothetical protein